MGTDFEKIEEPRHSPCEKLEKPDSPIEEIEKPYSPTDKVGSFDGVDGEPLEDGEIKEEKKEEESGEVPEDRSEEAMTAKPSKEEIKVEEKKPRKVKKSAEPKIEDEFHRTELPWMIYGNIKEVLNSESEGRITVLHFPNYDDMDAEVICGALEEFTAISSKHPKYLVIDNQEVLSHPCNGNTLDKLVEDHRENNMSVWVAATSPNSLPVNLLDYSTLARGSQGEQYERVGSSDQPQLSARQLAGLLHSGCPASVHLQILVHRAGRSPSCELGDVPAVSGTVTRSEHHGGTWC